MMQKYEKEQRDLTAEVENAKNESVIGMMDIPDEKEIQAMMDEVQKNPQKYRYVA